MTPLSTRVAGATVGSEEIDARIRHALFSPADSYVEQSPINGAWCIYHGEWKGRPKLFERPGNLPQAVWKGEYSRSIDAALALVERMLPETMWRLMTDPDLGTGYLCTLVPASSDTASGQGDTPALAILSALLGALSSSQDSPI